MLTGGPASPFSPISPSSMENRVGGTSQLRNPSVAGGVTGLSDGLVGRTMTVALVVLDCFVGLMTCLVTGLEVLAVVVLKTVGFEGLTLGFVGLEGTTLTGLVLGFNGVALDGVTLGLGGVFLAVVGWGFFRTVPWSDRVESGFILEGLVLVVAGIVGFFLFVPAIVFLEGFGGVGLVGF